MKKASDVYIENNDSELSLNQHSLIFGMICIDYKISTKVPKVIAYQKAEEIHAYQIHGQRLTLRQSLR